MSDSTPPRGQRRSRREFKRECDAAHLRKLRADAQRAEAEATTAKYQALRAGHLAAAAPGRLQQALEEQVTRLKLDVTRDRTLLGLIIVLVVAGLAGLIFNPLFSLGVLALLGAIAKGLRGRRADQRQEDDLDP